MKKLVIFDLDGTLLYTLEDLHASTNFALESEGLPARSLDEVRRFVGNVRVSVECALMPMFTRVVRPSLRISMRFGSFFAFVFVASNKHSRSQNENKHNAQNRLN